MKCRWLEGRCSIGRHERTSALASCLKCRQPRTETLCSTCATVLTCQFNGFTIQQL